MASILEGLARYFREKGEWEKLIPPAQQWLKMDRTNEDAYRYLMEAYARSGRHTAALKQYEVCIRALKDQLGITPQESTINLYQAIKKNGLVAQLPSRKIQESLTNNLPIQLTSFIGRENEIAEIVKLLSTNRLLTLTGVGGCGKTRLGLQVASSLVEEYSDGVWLVELASLSHPNLVLQKVASVLNI